MPTIKLSRCLIALVASAACLSSAGAANLVQIDGAHTTFFYDADFWGVGAASVIGDTISLQVRPEFDVTATVRPGTATGTQTQQNSDFASFGVVAVAKTGYALQTRVGSGLTGSYAVDAKGSEAQASLVGTVFAGALQNGAFVPQTPLTGLPSWANYASNGTAQAANFNVMMYSANPLSYANAVAVDSYLTTYVHQVGSGTAAMTLNTAQYAFSAVAVPEPQTYAMLLGGVVALSVASRRRKA
ncbi:PEP-CTERM protein-sorting domain-containing protein [Duganella sacchari]|uniref:PEP-CTERM protein-sorting domain-containing protein n=1 Tax=Duganella sacchari TaxID=551987 RepID=A0A1M7KDQ0_9BURK|nr:PEP-CTERM sorting domain-containing protein [Duganella sacchari]SHM63398.1 PEP-CTERM protein-sorting domain-containing protein [Duganella sacchari]